MEDLTLKNKNLEDGINKAENEENIRLWNEYKNLLEENKELNEILELENNNNLKNFKSNINSNELFMKPSIYNNNYYNSNFNFDLNDNQNNNNNNNNQNFNNDVVLFSYRKSKNNSSKFS